MMVRKTIRIGLHEIKTVDIACQFCKTRMQYPLDMDFKPHKCIACGKEYSEDVSRGLTKLREAFGYLHLDKKHITAFEIELKD